MSAIKQTNFNIALKDYDVNAPLVCNLKLRVATRPEFKRDQNPCNPSCRVYTSAMNCVLFLLTLLEQDSSFVFYCENWSFSSGAKKNQNLTEKVQIQGKLCIIQISACSESRIHIAYQYVSPCDR